MGIFRNFDDENGPTTQVQVASGRNVTLDRHLMFQRLVDSTSPDSSACLTSYERVNTPWIE